MGKLVSLAAPSQGAIALALTTTNASQLFALQVNTITGKCFYQSNPLELRIHRIVLHAKLVVENAVSMTPKMLRFASIAKKDIP
jgi:hypothetical protein